MDEHLSGTASRPVGRGRGVSVCIPLMHIADILFTPPPPAPCFKTSSLCLPGLHLRFPRGSLVTRAGLVEWNSAGAGLASAGSAWMLMLPGERMQGEAGAAGGGVQRGHGVCFQEGVVLGVWELRLTVAMMDSAYPLPPPDLLLLPCSSSGEVVQHLSCPGSQPHQGLTQTTSSPPPPTPRSIDA